MPGAGKSLERDLGKGPCAHPTVLLGWGAQGSGWVLAGAGQGSCKHQAWTHLQGAKPQHRAQELGVLNVPKLGNSGILPAEHVHLWQQGESKQGWQHLSQETPSGSCAEPDPSSRQRHLCFDSGLLATSLFLAPGDESVACWTMQGTVSSGCSWPCPRVTVAVGCHHSHCHFF